MSKKRVYTSLQDIRLARQKLRFETMLCEEKLKNSSDMLFTGLAHSVKDIGFYIRNRLFTYAFFRSVSKSGILYDFLANFVRGFKKSV